MYSTINPKDMTTNPSSTRRPGQTKKIKNKTKSPQVAMKEHDIVDIPSRQALAEEDDQI